MQISKQLAVQVGNGSWSSYLLVLEEYEEGALFVASNHSYRNLELLVDRSVLCVTGQLHQQQGKPLLPENYVADWRKRLEQPASPAAGATELAGYVASVCWNTTDDHRWNSLTRDHPEIVQHVTPDDQGVIHQTFNLGVADELTSFVWLSAHTDKFTLDQQQPSSPRKASQAVLPEVDEEDQLTLF